MNVPTSKLPPDLPEQGPAPAQPPWRGARQRHGFANEPPEGEWRAAHGRVGHHRHEGKACGVTGSGEGAGL